MTNIINVYNYKKVLIYISFLITCCLFLLVTYFSYSFYQERYSFKLINARVGTFLTNSSEADILITIYAEDVDNYGRGTNSYKVISSVPELGYKFKESNCKYGSNSSYNEKTKKIFIDAARKDECFAYFDLDKDTDLLINILLEEAVDSNTYIKNEFIPIYGYSFKEATCNNGSNITYDESTNSLYLTTSTKDVCNVYFDKNSGNIKANIYLNRNETYELINQIDPKKNYVVDKNSKCRLNYKNISSEITFINNKIDIKTQENAICDVILNESSNE